MFGPMALKNILNLPGLLNRRNIVAIVINRYNSTEQVHKKSRNEKGLLYGWGCNETGALPSSSVKFIKNPKYLDLFNISSIACGFGFTAFVQQDELSHKLYGIGLNTDHQINDNINVDIISSMPTLINLDDNNNNSKIMKVVAGRAHLLALTERDGLFLFGDNAYGQLGQRRDRTNRNIIKTLNSSSSPEQIIVDIACGQDHSIAITSNGWVFACGWGADGQTGLGHFNSTGEFTRIKGDLEAEQIVKVASRSDCVLALNRFGEVFGWGNNEYGQIGTNIDQQINRPIYLEKLKKFGRITDIASGGSFCLALNEHGDVFSWGYGALGGGAVQQSFEPVRCKLVDDIDGKEVKVEKVRCGVNYSMAITSEGQVYSWGRQLRYCLGCDTDRDQYHPRKLAINGWVTELECGIDHTLAICRGQQ